MYHCPSFSISNCPLRSTFRLWVIGDCQWVSSTPVAAGEKSYIAVAVTQSLSGIMRGAGDTMTPMWISLITTIIIRMPLAYGLAFLTRSEAMPNGNPDSLFISLLVSWVMGALLTTLFYRRGKWRRLATAKL